MPRSPRRHIPRFAIRDPKSRSWGDQMAVISMSGWHAHGSGGAVAAGHQSAVDAGMRVLQEGGNAADAAVATILALSVTDFGDFAFGGEVPLMHYSARTGKVSVLCGLGRSPLDDGATDWYLANGIPRGGDMKAAAVPGAPDLCATALQLYGTMSFAQVAGPTLELLDKGTEEWQKKLAFTMRRMIGAERKTAGTRQEKLLAASNRFYKGDIASELEAYYRAKGGFLRRGDLESHGTRIEEPVTIEYRGYTICKCGPWTQGPMLLQALRLLEHTDLKADGHCSADSIHRVAEALKLAMADRDTYYGDPLFVDVPLQQLLSSEYTALREALIDMQAACNHARPGDVRNMKPLLDGGLFRPGPGGTTTCLVADRWGDVVAATPSCNDVWGDKGVDSATGVAHGSRLTSLNTTKGHPNCIESGKRPRITLTPTLVLREGKPVYAVSVAGGDLQDQTTLNVLLNAIDFGMPPDKAVTAPRFATLCHEDSFNPASDRQAAMGDGHLSINASVDSSCTDALAARGHRVVPTDKPIGHPVMLYIEPETGVVHAAGDPNAGRHAAAID
ncbi:MAG: hypothetical protein GF331_15550 [Chitinivibrionales bacterium]|nr:hypothetical protein [Chitinivibrionales bacterium]